MQLQLLSGGRDITIDAFEPNNGKPSAAVVLLHGAGGNVGYWTSRFGPQMLAAGVALYAPHYFQRTGTTFASMATISDGVHVPQWLETLDDTIRFVASRPTVDPTRVALLGISLGGFLSLAYAADRSDDLAAPRTLRALVSISGGLVEPYAARATRTFPPTLIVHGSADTVVPVTYAHDLDQTLTRLGVAHETTILSRETHDFSSAAQLKIGLALNSFLSAQLH